MSDSADVPAGYSLAWNDEFNGTGLIDDTAWNYDTAGNSSHNYNNELEYYTDHRLENAKMEGGVLKITARKEAMIGSPGYIDQQYSSARLNTQGKHQFKYGYMEIRAKLPCGTGQWPAIWMLGTVGSWPGEGELDIMEYVGKNPHTIYGTTHTQISGGAGNGGTTTLATECTDFHNYEMLWTGEQIKFGVDGTYYYTYTNAHTGHDQWPFDDPEFMLLNLAIGGNFGGPTVDDSVFPTTMEVDYVRVYQKP